MISSNTDYLLLGILCADRSVFTSGHALCDFHGPVLVEKLNIQNCNEKRTQIEAKDLNSSYGKKSKTMKLLQFDSYIRLHKHCIVLHRFNFLSNIMNYFHNMWPY